jgi:hypothetical protein
MIGLAVLIPLVAWGSEPAKTNGVVQLRLGKVVPVLQMDGRLRSPALKPGTYETFPYTCIVVVPSSHPDDRALIVPPPHPDDQAILGKRGPELSMPTLPPNLRFIPRTLKQK